MTFPALLRLARSCANSVSTPWSRVPVFWWLRSKLRLSALQAIVTIGPQLDVGAHVASTANGRLILRLSSRRPITRMRRGARPRQPRHLGCVFEAAPIDCRIVHSTSARRARWNIADRDALLLFHSRGFGPRGSRRYQQQQEREGEFHRNFRHDVTLVVPEPALIWKASSFPD
jgi:hypothetical protein